MDYNLQYIGYTEVAEGYSDTNALSRRFRRFKVNCIKIFFLMYDGTVVPRGSSKHTILPSSAREAELIPLDTPCSKSKPFRFFRNVISKERLVLLPVTAISDHTDSRAVMDYVETIDHLKKTLTDACKSYSN